jgi:hypothetical protein
MILEDNAAVLTPYARAALPAFGVFGWAFAEFRVELFSPLLIAIVASVLLYLAQQRVVPSNPHVGSFLCQMTCLATSASFSWRAKIVSNGPGSFCVATSRP